VRLVQAARREPVDATPVWFMRQAGRFLPAYRALRERHSILEICRDADLAATATMTAIEAIPDLDAAIIFSDILLVLEPMGIQVEFSKGEGPVIANPVRDGQAVRDLRPIFPMEQLKGVLNAIAMIRSRLPPTKALIGFAGGPFTLASYLVKGGPSKDYLAVKSLMVHAPRVWHKLMTKLADAVIAHLKAQIQAGADVVQLFDSWAGALSPDDYREYVLPHSKRIFDELRETRAPSIHFGTDTAGLLELLKEAGGDVIGVDWRIRLDDAWARLGDDVAVQGNLDPVALFAPPEELLRRVDRVLEAAGSRPGHIFNLGHGVLPGTPVENVALVVERVHSKSAK
jgi:uroporphyrinogen decarboxylase